MSQDGPDSLWNNTHRAFLQALLARQTFTFAEARPILAKIQTAHDPARPVPENDITKEDFSHYIQALNDAISPFDLEIRSAEHQNARQHAGEQIWALVNTTSDAMTQMSTSHSADEIAYVKKVLDCMFETNNTRSREVMAVGSTEALQIAREGGGAGRRESGTQPAPGTFNLTQSQAEKMLRSMVREGWFEESPNNYFSLSPRALMELRGWLLDTYNDQDAGSDEEEGHQKIKFCSACKAILTIGQRCPDTDCMGRLHNHCVVKMWAAQGRREECPVCKTAWQNPGAVGEKAARRGGRQNGGASSGRASNGRRRTSGMNMDAGEDSDD